MAEELTKEQADVLLRDALIAHANAYDLVRSGELLDQYAVICAWTPPIGERGTHNYTTCFHQENVPTHVALGLFDLGSTLVTEGDED